MRKRNKISKILVTTILPEKYPQFLEGSQNHFSEMKDEKRIEEIVDICGRIWARTNQEIIKPML